MKRALMVAAAALLAGPLLTQPTPASAADSGNSGRPDRSWSGDGFAYVERGTDEYSPAAAVDARGRVVVAASSGTTNSDTGDYEVGIGLSRLTADGRPDPTFRVSTQTFGRARSSVIDVAVLSDGRTMVAGYSTERLDEFSPAEFTVARYLANGLVDTTFADGGVFHLDLDPLNTERAGQILELPDGRTVITATLSGESLGLVRLTRTGVLDRSFSGDGVATFGGFGNQQAQDYRSSALTDVRRLADGRIEAAYVSNSINTPNDGSAGKLRVLSDGTLDASLAGDGIAEANAPGSSQQDAVIAKFDRDGGVAVLTGVPTENGAQSIIKLTAAGEVDRTFGTAGRLDLTQSPAFETSKAESLTVESTGRLLLGGYASVGRNAYVTVQRITAPGAVDQGFAYDGVAVVQLGPRGSQGVPYLQPDGRVLIVGTAISGRVGATVTRVAVARVFSGSPADRDADSDGLADSDDRCDRTRSSSPTGCPTINRRLSIQLRKPLGGPVVVSGRVTGPASCSARQVVEVFRQGRAEPAVTTRASRTGAWRVRLPAKRGAVLSARVDRRQTASAFCSPATSRTVR